MSTKLIEKYTVDLKKPEKKGKSFFELAKKHIFTKKGVEKDLSSRIDEIRYGKR